MTTQYEISFTRYNRNEARRTLTPNGAITRSFENFKQASDHAEVMLVGMRMADPISEFAIAGITAGGYRVEPNRPEVTRVSDLFNVEQRTEDND